MIGDIHAHFRFLDPVLAHVAGEAVDGVLLVGDLGSHVLGTARQITPERTARYLTSVEAVLAAVRGLGVPVLWVPGNHDLPTLSGDGQVDGRVAEIAGLRVAGIGGAGPQRFGFPYEWTDEELAARPPPPCDILLAHAPPARTPLDHVPRAGAHVGSETLRRWCEGHRGFFVCGHIHESPGAVQLGACLCLNVGGLGKPFGLPQVGFLRRRDGVDTASHIDLVTGDVRSWTRLASPPG